jgi:hypothetical protein
MHVTQARKSEGKARFREHGETGKWTID